MGDVDFITYKERDFRHYYAQEAESRSCPRLRRRRAPEPFHRTELKRLWRRVMELEDLIDKWGRYADTCKGVSSWTEANRILNAYRSELREIELEIHKLSLTVS